MNITAALAAVLISVGGVQPAADSDLVIQPSSDSDSVTSLTPGIQRDGNSDVFISQNCYSWSPACTMIFSRQKTKNQIAPAASGVGNGVLATLVGICTLGAGKNGAGLCAAVFGTYNGAAQAAIAQAAANNQCVAYTTYFSDSLPGIWRTDNGPNCR